MATLIATQAIDMTQIALQFANFGTPSLVGAPSLTSLTIHSSTLNMDVTLTGTVSGLSITVNTIHVELPPSATAYDVSGLSLVVPFTLIPFSLTLPNPLDSLTGADTLTGSAFGDVLEGLGGADTIDGAGGNDTMTGGTGSDIFKLSTGNDTITDFGARYFTASLDGAQVPTPSTATGSANLVLNHGRTALT
jgi:Ca2+-binding RTX toxin-like protein